MIKFNFYLPVQSYRRLEELHKKHGISIAELIRRAIDAYLRRKENQ